MISSKEFEALVDELLSMEKELDALGSVVLNTSEGPYAMREQLLHDYPPQTAYDELLSIYKKKARIVEAHDMVARYKLAMDKAAA